MSYRDRRISMRMGNSRDDAIRQLGFFQARVDTCMVLARVARQNGSAETVNDCVQFARIANRHLRQLQKVVELCKES